MGWEWRNGRRYYYAADRVGGRVVKRYVGTGTLAESIAELDSIDQDNRKWERVERALSDARRQRGGRVARVLAAADAVLAGWLAAAGFHRPNRGPWRRKRGITEGAAMTTQLADRRPFDTWDAAALRAAGGAVPPELAPKDKTPDPAAVAAYLADHPAAVAYYGDLTRRVVQRVADQLGGAGQLPAAAILARADTLRRGLAGESPNPIELLLAERAVVCWAVVHQYESSYLGSLDKGRSLKEHAWHERRIDAAHRRLLAAVKTLAVVRRLKLPDLLAVVQVAGAPARPAARPAAAEAVSGSVAPIVPGG